MIININSDDKMLNNYESILKYLNFQKIEINNDLLDVIYKLSKNTDIHKLDTEQHNIILKQIKIFNNLNLDNKTDYFYYILIIESLPDFMIINLFRFFICNYLLVKNYNIKNPGKLEKNRILKFITFKNLKYNISDIIKSNNPKKIFIETLEDLSDNSNNILFFIHCMNLFFT